MEVDLKKLHVGYGTSKGHKSFAAGMAAAQEAVRDLKKYPLAAVLVFTSVCYGLEELLRGIHEVVGTAPVLGATTAGEVCNRPQQESVVVVALASSYLRVRVGVGQGVSQDWQQAVAQAVSAPELSPFFSLQGSAIWKELTIQGKSPFGLLFSPGNTKTADSCGFEILEELKRLSLGRVPFVGGAAADDWRMEANYVLWGRRAYPDSVLVAVFETQLRFGLAMAHGFHPTTKRATITRVSGHEVLELDGQPAAESYSRLQGTTREALSGKHLTLTTRRPVGISIGYGDYIITVASFFTACGGVRFTQPITEGAVLTIMDHDPDHLVAAGRDAFHKALLRGHISDPALALVFPCALRSPLLGDRNHEVITDIRTLAPGLPVVGFYSFGEQGLTDDGVNRHANEEITILVLGQQFSYGAQVALENEQLHLKLKQHTADLETANEKLLQEIDEHQQAEENLRENEEKYRRLIETYNDAIIIAEVDTGVILEANHKAQELLGLPLEKIIGMHQSQLHPPEEAERYHSIFRTHCEVGGAMTEEMYLQDSQGHRIPVEVSSSIIEVKGQRLIQGIFRDITERWRAEEALRRSEENYRLLVNQIPAVIYKGYTDWSLVCFDRKIEAIAGYAKEDFDSCRITWLDLIFPEDIGQAKSLLKEALKGDGSYVTEHRIRKKTGEVRWIQARNRIIRNAAGKIDNISGVFFDITERKELENQLIKAQRMEAVGILAGGMAHDFNNLLTAIMGYGEIMMMDLRQEDPFHLYVEEITKAAQRGASLTHQLLAFSRKQILQPRVINLNEVVLEMDKMLRRLIGEDIELVTLIDQELGVVKADPAQVEQIIMNLAVNARDAMPNGGNLTIETANVHLDQAYARSHMDVTPGPYVMLAVSDNGTGMDGETMSHIFEPFFTTKESGKGTGLGLAMVYGIVKQSGGHLWVYSESGQGTTFKVYFPRVEESLAIVRPKAAPVTSLEGDETILVVEDDAALRELISTALRRYGFKVLEAAHGGEALHLCEKEKTFIHLLLTDVVMPQISGSALAERLKQLYPEMKVLYMSGYTENAIVHHGVLNSDVNFISKPFKVLAMVQKVREVLDTT